MVVMLALASGGYFCATLPAQDNLEVFSDSQLPRLDDSDPALPPAEELPPVKPGTLPPRIDPEASEELPPSPATPSVEARPEHRAGSLPMDDSAFAAGDDELLEEDAAGEAAADGEILPQETIRERYDNGRVKIERGVAQDDLENYVNHGPWRMWDEAGNLIAEGVYHYGRREGKWTRWYQPDEADLFATPPFNLFSGPYVSQATFRDGELNGPWVIKDHGDLKICEWNFVAGRRHGESVWYYHTGRKLRVINYRAGELHGELLEWDLNGNPVTRVQYENGRRHEKTLQTYPDGQKKVEGMVLQARLLIKEPDDWWEAKMATYVAKGKDQKHGSWTAWYPNGQQRFAGEYQYDKPSGTFTWWHQNGQKSLLAHYENGLKQGQWTWWHPNGQKSIQGQYRDDSPLDRWVWWHDTGKVAQRIDFSQPGTPIANGGRVMSESVLLRPTSQ
jgi:antitoxin component YwqK of YwqJK toxin-antitoxin module